MRHTDRPCLAARARLRFDRQARRYLLVYPERALILNQSAFEILSRCDGTLTIAGIAAELAKAYKQRATALVDDIAALVAELESRRLVTIQG